MRQDEERRAERRESDKPWQLSARLPYPATIALAASDVSWAWPAMCVTDTEGEGHRRGEPEETDARIRAMADDDSNVIVSVEYSNSIVSVSSNIRNGTFQSI